MGQIQLINTPDPTYGLREPMIMPRASVLDTRQGVWQDRKRKWLNLTGNLSETRNGEFGTVGGGKKKEYTDDFKKRCSFTTINDGTSNFDPVLAELIYRWYCPAGGHIIDPFGGEQTKGVVAGFMGYKYTAVEFRQDQVDLNTEKTKQYPGVRYYCGDSNNISTIVQERGFDFSFTSPPYYDLEVYSKEDMSALGTYEEFMVQYQNIFGQVANMLKPGAHLVVKVGEIRNKKTGEYRNFVGDNVTCMQAVGLEYCGEFILVNSFGTAPVRAGNSMSTRKLVKVHQNVLVFKKP